jgi:hypothetical protein
LWSSLFGVLEAGLDHNALLGLGLKKAKKMYLTGNIKMEYHPFEEWNNYWNLIMTVIDKTKQNAV